jgi:hypothetical protein
MRKLVVLFCLGLSPAAVCGQALRWLPFNWETATLSGRHFDKVAITVPVTIDNLPHKFNMQLDLGAVTTVVYGNTIAPYLEKYPALKAKIDTTRTFRIQSQKNVKLAGVALALGGVQFGLHDVGYFKNYGDSLTATALARQEEVHVGTIAPDLFLGKVLIIDYPRKRLCVSDKVPAQFARAAFQPFKLKDGRIKIPLRINSKSQDLLFDTGASLFALSTTEAQALAATTGPVQDSLKISSWGEYYYVYGRQLKGSVAFGSKRLPTTLAFYDKKNRYTKFFEEESIWGMTGNAYFLNNTVIIDYKNHVFGVL